MPVNYTPPTAESLLPVPGVALGTAAASIKNWDRDDVLLVVVRAGHGRGRRVHAEPLLRGAGDRVPRALAHQHAHGASAFARWSSTPATPMRAPASRASPRRARPARRSARLLGCAPRAGAAVFDRRDHGAAAGRADRRRRCRSAHAAAARRRLVRGGARDHDHRHRAEGRVAPDPRRRRRR